MASSAPPPPQPSLISTPIAIVAAGALIGLGLFFGLRSQPEAPALSSTALGAAPTASADVPLPLGPGPAPTVTAAPTQTAATATSVADRKAVAAQLKAALDQHKKMIVEQCVAPSLAKKPTPDHVNLTFNFSVDASGKQSARGVSEDRETSRSDVTQCVQAKLPALSIPPPGVIVFVEDIVWKLP
jgi:hypothetical protein